MTLFGITVQRYEIFLNRLTFLIKNVLEMLDMASRCHFGIVDNRQFTSMRIPLGIHHALDVLSSEAQTRFNKIDPKLTF